MVLNENQRKVLVDSLNFESAWQIIEHDETERVFFRHPIENRLIHVNLPAYLKNLQKKLLEGNYYPSLSPVCEKPKRGGLIRPGVLLSKEDQLLYSALIDSNLDAFRGALSWSQGVIDFSYPLATNDETKHWFSDNFRAWSTFREQSINQINNGVPFVLITDLSGFYDQISIGLLLSDLRAINIANESIEMLSVCLNTWALSQARGLPQGYSPSDMLGKLFLNSIDHSLQNNGIVHMRYVDDIRVFCQTESEARQAIIILSRLLREKGLSLQSSKTKILTAPQALLEIEGVAPIVAGIAKDLEVMADEIEGGENPYLTPAQIDAILRVNPNLATPEILEKTYEKEIINAGDSFSSTLLHYLLNRLGNLGNRVAFSHCKQMLLTHPEETEYIIGYFRKIRLNNVEADAFLCDFLLSRQTVYAYQKYEILKWILEDFPSVSSAMLSIVRESAFDNNQPSYLRSYAREILGKRGERADFDRLRSVYNEAQSPLQQSEIIYGIRRMEKARRNEFYGRVRNSHELNARAVELAGG